MLLTTIKNEKITRETMVGLEGENKGKGERGKESLKRTDELNKNERGMNH